LSILLYLLLLFVVGYCFHWTLNLLVVGSRPTRPTR
jgi:hypothetical protein